MTRLFQDAQLDESQANIINSILDSMGDAVVVADLSGVLILVNSAARRMFGLKAVEDASGQTLPSFVLTEADGTTECPPERRPLARALQGEAVNGFIGMVRRNGDRGKDGTWVSVNARPLSDSCGAPVGAIGVYHDITELRRSQEDFRMLVDAALDYAILMTGIDGTIQSWNSGAERIFGMSAQQAVGRSIVELFTTEDRMLGEPLREFEEAKINGRSEDDRWHVRSDGSRFWGTGVVAPLRTPEGELRGFVKILRDQTRQRMVQEQTHFLANHDMLTGLPNRVQFSNQLHTAIATSERSNVPFALLLLDLDRFKHVNDTFGHLTGDLLLKEVALRIMSSIRETDFVARLGGDEFVILQRDVSQPEAAEGLARKLVLELGRPYQLETREVVSGTSIGICLYGRDARNSVELLKCADLALYRAKNVGRHTYQFHTPELKSEETWRRDREAGLRNALEQHRFELYYQPQVDLHNWEVSTVEVLLRWRVSDIELLLPDDFLGIAEETGMIVQIGEWALREACSRVQRWHEQGLADLRLSVNCSARQFNDPQFVARIPAILEEAGIEPSSLDVEIPEAMLAQHPEIRERLVSLRALGIRLTIDNFGTGTTALMDFKDFGIDALKIDKAFVQHLPHRREDSAIAAAIISFAHNLGISVVAGGVETAEQLAYLKARDCTGAQGFIFSPPLPAEKFEELMLSGAWSRINAGVDSIRPPEPKLH